MDFLTGRPQVVTVENNISTSLTLNKGAPQGCVLSPHLYSLFTHPFVAMHALQSVIKFAGDTVVGLSVVSGKQPLTQRQQNIGDDRGLQETAGAPPIHIKGTVVEKVESSLANTSQTN